MRAAVVMGPVIPEQLALWYAVKDAGIALTIVGTDSHLYEGRLPGQARRPPGIDCVLLPLVSPAPRRGQVWWTYSGLSSVLRRLRPNLIHVLSEPWGGLVLQTLRVKRLARLSPSVCVHGADNIFDHGNRVERLSRRLILSRVWPRIDGFASWSHGGIEAARGAGLPPVPTTAIPAIVPDPVRFPVGDPDRTQARSGFGLPRNEPVVGYVGRLHQEKGVGDLLRAVGSLGPSAPFLAVWGAGPLETTVREAISTGRVRGWFGGALGPEEVSGALQACDVIAVPSRTTSEWKEQFGRVIVEAMMAGTAAVAYRSGAIPEVVGDGGLLVDEGDIRGLAAAIRKLTTDPPSRSELVAKGRREALRRFHPQVLADGLASFWSDVLSR